MEFDSKKRSGATAPGRYLASITNAPGATPEVLTFVENLHALKRMATPEEIARSVLHLASGASPVGVATKFSRRCYQLPRSPARSITLPSRAAAFLQLVWTARWAASASPRSIPAAIASCSLTELFRSLTSRLT